MSLRSSNWTPERDAATPVAAHVSKNEGTNGQHDEQHAAKATKETWG